MCTAKIELEELCDSKLFRSCGNIRQRSDIWWLFYCQYMGISPYLSFPWRRNQWKQSMWIGIWILLLTPSLSSLLWLWIQVGTMEKIVNSYCLGEWIILCSDFLYMRAQLVKSCSNHGCRLPSIYRPAILFEQLECRNSVWEKVILHLNAFCLWYDQTRCKCISGRHQMSEKRKYWFASPVQSLSSE